MMSRGNTKYETTCGKVIWENRSVAVCVHIYAKVDGVIYVAANRRGAQMDQGGLWCMPCGYLDWDETTEQGARREVLEEMGIELGGLELIRVDDAPASFKQNITFAYRAWVDGLLDFTDDGAEAGEVLEMKWIRADRVSDYRWAFEHDRMISADLAEIMADR